jgi:hypothetical protein
VEQRNPYATKRLAWFILDFSLLALGCGPPKHLSSSLATEKIKEGENKGHNYGYYSFLAGYPKECDVPCDDFATSCPKYANLQQMGLISAECKENHRMWVAVTEEGERRNDYHPIDKNKPQDFYMFTVIDWTLIGVTEIKETSEVLTEVTYQWKWTLTDDGRLFKEKGYSDPELSPMLDLAEVVNEEKVTLKRSDFGWFIERERSGGSFIR